MATTDFFDLPNATTSADGLMAAADKTKLNGIEPEATANSEDAELLDRANHTGQQPASSISDFTEATQDVVGTFLSADNGDLDATYNDAGNAISLVLKPVPDLTPGEYERATVTVDAKGRITGIEEGEEGESLGPHGHTGPEDGGALVAPLVDDYIEFTSQPTSVGATANDNQYRVFIRINELAFSGDDGVPRLLQEQNTFTKGHAIYDDDGALTQKPYLLFTGDGVTASTGTGDFSNSTIVTIPGATGGASVIVADEEPEEGTEGGLWLNTSTDPPTLYAYTDAWRLVGAGGGGSGSSVVAKVSRTTNQAIPNETNTALSFDTVEFDDNELWDAAEPTRLTCKEAGFYRLVGSGRFQTSGGGIRYLAFRVNGTDFVSLAVTQPLGGGPTEFPVIQYWPLEVGDYVELLAYHNNGGSLNIERVNPYSPWFVMEKVGGGGGSDVESPYTAPVNDDFTWINQVGASVAQEGATVYLKGTTATDRLRMRVKAAPATPYVLTACIVPDFTFLDGTGNYQTCGILFRESGTGKVLVIGPSPYDSIELVPALWVARYSAPNTHDTNQMSKRLPWYLTGGAEFWLRISNDGTDLKFFYSSDAKHWQQYYTEAKAAYFSSGPDQIGFYVSNNANGSLAPGVTVRSWEVT